MHTLAANINRKEKKSIWYFLFAWLLLDSLVVYFLQVGVNALLPFLVIIGFLFDDNKKSKIGIFNIVCFGFLGFGMMLGVGVGVEEPFDSVKHFVTCFCAFIIGFKSTSRQRIPDFFLKLISVIGMLYAFVCTAALLGLSSTYLPVEYAVGYNDGTLVERAELTTDQNYQIYYLFPLLLSLTVKNKFLFNCFLILSILSALFVIIEMETRSGLIFFVISFFMQAFIMYKYRSSESAKILYLIIPFFLLLSIVGLPLLIELSQGITLRFTNSEFSTFWGRIHSTTFFFKNILNPSFWIPRGQDYFLAAYGQYAHSSITHIYLLSGIFGAVGWSILIFRYSTWAVIKTLQGALVKNHSILATASILSVGISLTLPGPLYEQLWLWVGCSFGIYNIRNSEIKRTARF